jgi:hypothetical protein
MAKVEKRLVELQKAMAERADVTEESLLNELEQARQVASQNSQASAMVSATVAKGKLTGHFVERQERGNPGDFSQDQTPEQIIARLRDLGDDKAADIMQAMVNADKTDQTTQPSQASPGKPSNDIGQADVAGATLASAPLASVGPASPSPPGTGPAHIRPGKLH